MSRPMKCRIIARHPAASGFKPIGIPAATLSVVRLGLDEFEAVRLADGERQYQEAAASHMGVSRQTFGQILDSAHAKIADALIHGKLLVIEGGAVMMNRHQGACGCHGAQCRHGQSVEKENRRETTNEGTEAGACPSQKGRGRGRRAGNGGRP